MQPRRAGRRTGSHRCVAAGLPSEARPPATKAVVLPRLAKSGSRKLLIRPPARWSPDTRPPPCRCRRCRGSTRGTSPGGPRAAHPHLPWGSSAALARTIGPSTRSLYSRHSSGESDSKTTLSRSKRSGDAVRREQVAQWCSVPHSVGRFQSGGGGGRCEATALNIWPLPPSGVQAATAIVPPERVTRTTSAAATSWRGANIAPNVDSTLSKESSGKWKLLRVPLHPLALDSRLVAPCDERPRTARG